MKIGNTSLQHYLVLDASRFIAALVVVLYHIKEFVYPQADLGINSFLTKSYLAVDLFFLMSGIVIAKSYEQKLISKKMSFKDFLIVRFIRLYPLYISGLLLGLSYLIIKSLLSEERPDSWLHVFRSLGLNAVFFPDIWNKDGIFILDPASWSLALEWMINLIYAGFAVFLSTRILSLITLISGCILIWFGIQLGNLDWGWSASNFAGGGIRIIFSFTLGIILFRLINKERITFKSVNPFFLLFLVTLFLIIPFNISHIFYDLFCVLVVFPVFVVASCFSDVGQKMKSSFFLMGQTSYALYILHTPLILWIAGLWKMFMGDTQSQALLSFLFIIGGVVGPSFWATRYFHVPVTIYLKKLIPISK